jgi:hypothetical protein
MRNTRYIKPVGPFSNIENDTTWDVVHPKSVWGGYRVILNRGRMVAHVHKDLITDNMPPFGAYSDIKDERLHELSYKEQ